MKLRFRTRAIIYSIPLFIIIVIISIHRVYNEEQIKTNQFSEWWLNENFKGIIHDKFIDFDNHMMETIIIYHDSDTITTGWITDDSGLYDYSRIGDSIIKVGNSFDVYIVRHDCSQRRFKTYSYLEK